MASEEEIAEAKQAYLTAQAAYADDPSSYDGVRATYMRWRQARGWDQGTEPTREQRRLAKLNRRGIRGVWQDWKG